MPNEQAEQIGLEQARNSAANKKSSGGGKSPADMASEMVQSKLHEEATRQLAIWGFPTFLLTWIVLFFYIAILFLWRLKGRPPIPLAIFYLLLGSIAITIYLALAGAVMAPFMVLDDFKKYIGL